MVVFTEENIMKIIEKSKTVEELYPDLSRDDAAHLKNCMNEMKQRTNR